MLPRLTPRPPPHSCPARGQWWPRNPAARWGTEWRECPSASLPQPPRPPAPPLAPTRAPPPLYSGSFAQSRARASTTSQSPRDLTSVGSRPQRTAPWGSTHPGVARSRKWGRTEPRNELCNRQGPQPLPRRRSAALPPRVLGRQPIGHWGSRRLPPPRGRRRHLRSGQASLKRAAAKLGRWWGSVCGVRGAYGGWGEALTVH